VWTIKSDSLFPFRNQCGRMGLLLSRLERASVLLESLEISFKKPQYLLAIQSVKTCSS
jgi:hypothetical protein